MGQGRLLVDHDQWLFLAVKRIATHQQTRNAGKGIVRMDEIIAYKYEER